MWHKGGCARSGGPRCGNSGRGPQATHRMHGKPGSQYRDHPNMAAGRAALPRPLADFANHEFAVQCPTFSCRFRRFPAARIAEAQAGITVGEALPGCDARTAARHLKSSCW